MHKLIVATIFAAGVAANAHACPIGSFPSVDSWGNQICKTLDTRQTNTIQGSVENCPVGTHPWVDSWGNKICQSFTGGAQYHDTSGGCLSAWMQVGDERFNEDEINRLYDNDDYPLRTPLSSERGSATE